MYFYSITSKAIQKESTNLCRSNLCILTTIKNFSPNIDIMHKSLTDKSELQYYNLKLLQTGFYPSLYLASKTRLSTKQLMTLKKLIFKEKNEEKNLNIFEFI